MNIFISVDMEGISGIVDSSYTQPENCNYHIGTTYMTEDINAVVKVLVDSGAERIVVADGHHLSNNLRIDKLHPSVELIMGVPRDGYMMTGLDSTFNAVFFVGYHARHGSPGVLSHTYSFKNVWVNDMLVGEIGFNTIYAGMLGVPVCFISGDDMTAKEAHEIDPMIATAIVKKAISRTSANCLSGFEAKKELQAKAAEAVQLIKDIKPFQTNFPVQVKLEFFHTGEAELASMVPGVYYERGSTEVRYTATNPSDYYMMMDAVQMMASKAIFF